MIKNLRLGFGILGLILLVLALWQINFAQLSGLQVQTIRRKNDSPVTFLIPQDAQKASRPLVLVGHGFAGSGVIMHSFAYPIAHAGYVVALWDFDGHGRNPRPMSNESGRSALLGNVEAVLAEAQRLEVYAQGKVAILGHSMGSGVALQFGQTFPETMATIAVSPTGTQVTPELPHNLLLMAGQNEPGFVSNARQRLVEAGGAGGDPAAGTGRRLVIIPMVEHITILFSGHAHQEAVNWLNATFGVQPGAQEHPARLLLWYGIGILGGLLSAMLLIPASPAVDTPADQPGRRNAFGWRLLALFGGALTATLLLALVARLGVALPGLFGFMVGGYLLVWFALAGIVALLILRTKIDLPTRQTDQFRTIGLALLVFAFLWVGVGWLGEQVWLPWLLIPKRLALWPLGVICFLPWFLAVGEVIAPARALGRLGWWLAQSVAVIAALFIAMQITQGLFFLTLILPIFPFMLGFHALAACRQGQRWVYGLSGALFTSWLVLAVFPLA